MLFSQRKGIKPGKSVIQIDSMDDNLRNSLWNALTLCYWDWIKKYDNSTEESINFVKEIWVYHFKKPLDTLPNFWFNIHKAIKNQYDNYTWYEIYDFIEYVANGSFYKSIHNDFINLCNSFLESELSAYRFVGGKITQITSQEEISEVEEALNISNPFKPVSIHIKRALTLFSDKKSPDYRNSIKESISAVEAICKLITKKEKTDLGQALKILENKIGLHPALKKSFNNLYGIGNGKLKCT